jgi:Filamentous haemagglutinin family outer membrane protein
VLSDADPAVMPTLANIAAVLAPFNTAVTPQSEATAALPSTYPRIATLNNFFGGANFLAGQDPSYTVLGGDSFAQLIRDTTLQAQATQGTFVPTIPTVETGRHGGLHVNDANPARIFALNGDVTQPPPPSGGVSGNFLVVNLAKTVEVLAGRDVGNLELLGQNNSPTDVTSIVAGRDVIYPTMTGFSGSTPIVSVPNAVEIGGPGNLLIESGRNIDLGSSAGIQTFGNLLNTRLPSSEGAGITIQAGLGTSLPDYTGFITQYVNGATDGTYAAPTNPFAEPLQLFDAQGHVIGNGAEAYAYLQSQPPAGKEILLNRIFFDLLRDSGREHTGAAGNTNYELGSQTIDTLGQLNAAFANYQRAFAAVGTFLQGTSGTGSFLGGLSTVRTRDGGNITILAPHGQIQVGQVTQPVGFLGYSIPTDPSYALGFGIVTERGGNVDLYADGNVSVNQSRVFTLEGGDLTVVSRNADIDAGKGAKTVQAIQPANVSFDTYGNVTITPFGPASGSGLAVLRALPTTPPGNADLIAPNGIVNAGDAGIRVSGNLNIAALLVLNAGNIQVGGKATGVPVVEAPNIGALTSASNTAGAASKSADTPTGSAGNDHDRPSIIIVEVLGYGGCDEQNACPERSDQPQRQPERPKTRDQRSQNPGSPIQIVGAGRLTEHEQQILTDEEKRDLVR